MKLDRKESTNFTLRMSVDLRLELEKIAKNQGRTVTNLINYVMQQYTEEYQSKKNRDTK